MKFQTKDLNRLYGYCTKCGTVLTFKQSNIYVEDNFVHCLKCNNTEFQKIP
jgi:exosome complex RNA-binding protein Csl4